MSDNSQKKKEYTLAKIRQSNDFPVMSSTITLLNKFNSKDDISITEFANVILKDLALTTKILKIINSVHFMQFGEVTTISRAIILLGYENVKNLAMTLILFDQLHKYKTNIHLMESILKSFYSALLAEKISSETEFVDKEEAFICSLFHIFGKIIVSFAMPDKIAEIEEYMQEYNANESIASMSVLGMTFEDIGTTISKDWNFPNKIVYSMKKMPPSELSENQNETDKLRTVSTFTHTLSNAIASYTTISEREESINKIINTYGVLFKSHKKNIIDLIRSSVDDYLQFSNVFNVDLKKSLFSQNLLSSQDAQLDNKIKIVDKHEDTSSSSEMQTIDEIMEMDSYEGPDSIFRKGIQDINKSLLSGFSLNDIIRIVLETIYRGLQLSQEAKVLFVIKDTKRPVMVARYGFGAEVNETKEWFEVSLNDRDDIFQRAITNQKDLVIKNMASQEIRNILPDWYKRNMKGDIFVILLPIVINGVSIGLYYIDGKREGIEKLSSMHLNNLKILRDQTVMAIKQKRGF